MPFELTKEYIEKLRLIVEEKDDVQAKTMMADLYAVDIAEIYDDLDIDEAKYLYLLIEDREKAADVLAELEDDDRERFLKVLPSELIARKFLDFMDSDDAADVLGDMPEKKQEEVLAMMQDTAQAGDIVDLLNYDEDTAGGLMGKELIAVNQNWTIAKCIDEIRRQASEIDDVYYVYSVNDENVLMGALSLKELILNAQEKLVSSVVIDEIISVKVDMDSEEVANVMDKYDLIVLPVIDSIGRLLGRITIDDVVDIIRDEAEKDYQMISGITEDIEPSDSVVMQTRARLPWLLIGLVGGIMGAKVISGYENDLAEHASMAFFIPLIAAMGGNVGVQSSSIVVQSLASNALSLESAGQKLLKEVSVALINAIVCSAIIFGYNYFFSDSFALTLSVSAALFIVIVFASIFGTFVPLALNRLKIDPALATGPFITTVNDILGLLVYLMIGRMIFTMV